MVSITNGVICNTDLVKKIVKLWQRQQIPKFYDNIKVDLIWL